MVVDTINIYQSYKLKKAFLNILILVSIFQANSQVNLVPNGSFEDKISCPTGTNNFQSVAEWYSPNTASPDYYNACDTQFGGGVPQNDWGFQYAQDGNAYSGLLTLALHDDFLNYREYIQVKLNKSLQKDSIYCWSFYVSRIDNIDYVSNNIGIALTESPITSSDNERLDIPSIYSHPDIIFDNKNWVLIHGEYQAIGGELYLTVGNFEENINTSTQQIANGSNGGKSAGYYIDNVWFGLGGCILNVKMPDIFTPNGDGINDIFEPIESNVSHFELSIYNRWGSLVYNSDKNLSWDGTFLGKSCSEGVYFYVIKYPNGSNGFKYLKGFFQLVR